MPAIPASATAASAGPAVNDEVATVTPKAPRQSTTASPSATTAIRAGSQRRRARDNVFMSGVSQALADFANHHRRRSAPGIEVIVTPRYEVTLQPDFPIAGPNSVTWVRCSPGETADVIRAARAAFRPQGLPFLWILDPQTEPPDFAERLLSSGCIPDPHGAEVLVMALPVDATIGAPDVPGLEIHDALADPATFTRANIAAAEAFEAPAPAGDAAAVAALERRRLNALAAGNQRYLLATVHGEPAGAAGMSLYPPAGATINGGSVRPRFRGRGVYRAMVAARLDTALRAGVAGLAVWGGEMSAPILAGLGFETVGWKRFYLDLSSTSRPD
jgi:GNAT superfamily N-acetyltransferase